VVYEESSDASHCTCNEEKKKKRSEKGNQERTAQGICRGTLHVQYEKKAIIKKNWKNIGETAFTCHLRSTRKGQTKKNKRGIRGKRQLNSSSTTALDSARQREGLPSSETKTKKAKRSGASQLPHSTRK
jgi:hypothetical protein